MPKKLIWLPEQDEKIREFRRRGATWDQVAADFGLSRFTIIDRARRIKADKIPKPKKIESELENLLEVYRGDPERPALAPGDPATWGPITDRTVLHGLLYRDVFVYPRF